ncbi:MAG: TRAP transporter substrate-binding protein [Burkholderiales bacterium]|jgi:TRAP-type mannitol/chloroaromatic compound transport system substrate-binding protein|nr:TRAP transporter substrate-binding protein [Burkholderiales bacterium]
MRTRSAASQPAGSFPATSTDSPAATRKPARRAFLAGGAAAGAAALSFPAVTRAQPAPTKLRFQSAWPVKTIFHEFAVDFTRKVEEMSGGRLLIQMLPAGSVVGALQTMEAVSKGVLDGGHGVPGFWFGRNTAFGLYGAGPNFAMNADQTLGWIEYGGGRQLYEELLKEAQLDVVSLLYAPVPCEPFGWFRKEVKSVADLKGLRYRTAGLAVELMQVLGAAPVQMAAGDIVPALDRGLIDAAEFAQATDDRILGFPDVAKIYYQRSYHMANNMFEIMINRKTFESLPAELRTLLRLASQAASADMSWKAMDRISRDFIELQTKQKVRALKTPRPILDAQLKAWSVVIDRHAKTNPLFLKIVESQREWARRVVYWNVEVTVDPAPAYNHFFGKTPV